MGWVSTSASRVPAGMVTLAGGWAVAVSGGAGSLAGGCCWAKQGSHARKIASTIATCLALLVVMELVRDEKLRRRERGHVIGHLCQKLCGAFQWRRIRSWNPPPPRLTSKSRKRISGSTVKVCKEWLNVCK